MPGTYTQIYIHIVFAVKARQSLIHKSWSQELNRYIAGVINVKGHKSFIVNGAPDHIHCLVSMKPSLSLSDLVRDIKSNSSRFINEKKFTPFEFRWQEGYGAFSCTHSQLNTIYQYILNQEQHHKKQTFRDEYEELLRNYQVDFSAEYLFEWIE